MAFLVFQSPNLWITKLETPLRLNLSYQNFLMSFHASRPSDRNAADQELSLTVKKATSPEETAPKQKHVRSKYTAIGLGSFFLQYYAFTDIPYLVQNVFSTPMTSKLRLAFGLR